MLRMSDGSARFIVLGCGHCGSGRVDLVMTKFVKSTAWVAKIIPECRGGDFISGSGRLVCSIRTPSTRKAFLIRLCIPDVGISSLKRITGWMWSTWMAITYYFLRNGTQWYRSIIHSAAQWVVRAFWLSDSLRRIWEQLQRTAWSGVLFWTLVKEVLVTLLSLKSEAKEGFGQQCRYQKNHMGHSSRTLQKKYSQLRWTTLLHSENWMDYLIGDLLQLMKRM